MTDKGIINILGSKGLSSYAGNKRKFVPNIKKALNKQSSTNESAAKISRPDPKSRYTATSKEVTGTGPSRRPGTDGASRFVQSYSIFESGIGCVVKNSKSGVELREVQASNQSRTETEEVSETEFKDAPVDTSHAFISDIKQSFKDPPLLMRNSVVEGLPPVDPFKDMDLSNGRSHQAAVDFFKEAGHGRLFTLQIPDRFLLTDSDTIMEGQMGKIQILDNQRARLVFGGVMFDLICPQPLIMNSDVVIADQRNDDSVRLNCLGHLDQSVLAVPDLDSFVHLGQ